MSAALLQQFDHSGRCRGGTMNFPTWGLTLQTGGAKIRFSGYYKCQKSPKMVSNLPTGRLACSYGGAITPSSSICWLQ